MSDENDTTKTCVPPVEATSLALPRGVGIFFRHLSSSHQPAHDCAAKCKKHGVRWVALMAIALDRPKGESVPRTLEFADAFARAGIDVFLWGFPVPATPLKDTLGVLDAHLAAFPYKGFIFDVEGQYGHRPRETDDFLRAMRSRLVGQQCLVGTGFAVRSAHKEIPWDVLATHLDQYLFQAYQVVTAEQAQHAITDLGKIFREVAGIGPAYGTNSGVELNNYLDACYLSGGKPRTKALGIWSWPQLDGREWPALERWSKLFAS